MSRLPPLLEQHFRAPRNAGAPPSESVSGSGSNAACGDELELWLAPLRDGRFRAGFHGRGCSASLACASLIASSADGATLEELRRLDVAAALERAGGLPPTSRHALELVARAFGQALARASPPCHP